MVVEATVGDSSCGGCRGGGGGAAEKVSGMCQRLW